MRQNLLEITSPSFWAAFALNTSQVGIGPLVRFKNSNTKFELVGFGRRRLICLRLSILIVVGVFLSQDSWRWVERCKFWSALFGLMQQCRIGNCGFCSTLFVLANKQELQLELGVVCSSIKRQSWIGACGWFWRWSVSVVVQAATPSWSLVVLLFILQTLRRNGRAGGILVGVVRCKSSSDTEL